MNTSSNTPPPARYTKTAIALHWIIALGIFSAFAMGFIMTDLPISPARLRMYNWHKWTGITVLTLAVVRSLWRMTHAAPPTPSMPALQATLAHAAHALLYLAMFAMPLTGWLFSNAKGYPVVYLGVLPLPNLLTRNEDLAHALHEVHETFGWVLLVIIALHVAAALKHQFIDRDGLMDRMRFSK